MSEYVIPAGRLSARAEAPEAYKAMLDFARVSKQGLGSKIAMLVLLRASQINGCGYCVDLHSRDARKDGEDERRLHNVATWQHSPLFTAKERAALALTEAMTLLVETQVPDDVWQEAEKHFDPTELSHLALTIAAINALNRIGVGTRMVPAAQA